jgi:hypothetical protein
MSTANIPKARTAKSYAQLAANAGVDLKQVGRWNDPFREVASEPEDLQLHVVSEWVAHLIPSHTAGLKWHTSDPTKAASITVIDVTGAHRKSKHTGVALIIDAKAVDRWDSKLVDMASFPGVVVFRTSGTDTQQKLTQRTKKFFATANVPTVKVLTTAKNRVLETDRRSAEPQAAFDHNQVMVFSITGCLTSRDDKHAVLNWFGGDELKVRIKQMFGAWKDLSPGDWFKAVILRCPNGNVVQAILQNRTDPPRYLDEEEIESAFSRIKPAKLTPME